MVVNFFRVILTIYALMVITYFNWIKQWADKIFKDLNLLTLCTRETPKWVLLFTNSIGEISSRVLDLRPMSHGFKPHRRHCVVFLSKTH